LNLATLKKLSKGSIDSSATQKIGIGFFQTLSKVLKKVSKVSVLRKYLLKKFSEMPMLNLATQER
jgi:hypothetical protein